MNESSLPARERALLRDLARRAAARARDEKLLGQTAPHARASAEAAYASGAQEAETRLKAGLAAAEREGEEERAQIQALCDEELAAAARDFDEEREALKNGCEEAKEAARAKLQEARWTLNAMLERNTAKAEELRRDSEKRLTAILDRLVSIRGEADALWDAWDDYLDPAARGVVGPRDRNPRLSLRKSLAALDEKLADLRKRLGELALPKLLRGGRLTMAFAVLGVLLIYPLGLLVSSFAGLGYSPLTVLAAGLVTSAVVGVAVGVTVKAVLEWIIRRQVRSLFRVYPMLCRAVDSVALRCRQRTKGAASRCRRQITVLKKQHRRAQRHARLEAQRDWAAAKRRLDEALPQALERCRARKDAAGRRLETDLRGLDREHDRRLTETRRAYEGRTAELESERRKRLEEIEGGFDRGWQVMASEWRSAVAELRAGVDAAWTECRRLFPPWDDACWADGPFGHGRETVAERAPPVLQFGLIRVGKEQIAELAPEDARLKAEAVDDFTLPAVNPFPDGASLLLLAEDAGRAKAVDALQAVIYRLLTATPPGKVRFTILDPVGLGQNFAAFMDLADHDDLLVTSRIWTEAAHIEQRLADLTAHMENVIQKYLRDRYPTINDYNAMAGEVAEPFRVLVVANFPTNFTPEACRRLVSIAQNGPRCGVLTLISVDRKQPMPEGFDLADLRPPHPTLSPDAGGDGRVRGAGVRLTWAEGRFVWDDADFGRFPLELEAPPPAELGARLLDRVGRLSRAARHVEVPFEFIVPPRERWWSGDSRAGLDVPLGRSGATSRQHLRLGQGTAQHVLIVGKTGSGKSTLLHALITTLALLYSPDEVELYLVDFKKGVEFKAYAAHGLPHARVIAVESEREFGLSVLQRLDAEMKTRGECFRAAGAQDLNAYRCATAASAVEGGATTADAAVAHGKSVRMPRILLVVDEFQEFFTEDDRLAQDAAQLLDRLVRQGRAFGLHVLLGSQTLGGAYSLARSTVDQMAIRIALQCSEADAQLILSADNAAARLLSRPGEAIYNDANGLVQGNNPFQVVWLSDEKREEYLKQIRNMAMDGGARPPAPVVFEGNAPADVADNQPLRRLLQGGPPAGRPADGLRAWLGDALAINDQTAAVFRRQNGGNLLIVGQQDQAALGVLTAAVVSLAAQSADARFHLIDGRQAEAPASGPWARLPEVLPNTVRLAGWRGAAAMVQELAAELERRQKAPEGEAAPAFLVIQGFQRCRDLRRREDDFGFGRPPEEGPNPPKEFADLLRDGAAVGIHVLLWCDTLLNLQRTVDRAGLRELALRVLFQMSIADSSNLIDNPLAGKLGMHRALFASEEDGRLEKFRPYGVPSDEWLDWVKERLRGRPS